MSSNSLTSPNLIWVVLIPLLISPFTCLATPHQKRGGMIHQSKIGQLAPDLRVARGLELSEHPLAHSISLQQWEMVDLPRLESLSKIEKLELAVREFKIALQNTKDFDGYGTAQVQGFLGRTLKLLGAEFLARSEQHPRHKRRFKSKATTYFESSVWYYQQAIKTPGYLRYYWAKDLIRSILASGDLNRALTTINDLEQKNVAPKSGVDHGLFMLKGEILWIMGREKEAGLAYEEWIRRGHTDANSSGGSLIYERLVYLKENTGHPNNLSPKSTSKD